MSFDINWEEATSGPDGEELAERIRSFIHDKFQQIALPRFIRSVEVSSFNLGTVPPELEIKDLSDPFADFYEADSDDEDVSDAEAEEHKSSTPAAGQHAQHSFSSRAEEEDKEEDEHRWPAQPSSSLRDGQLDGALIPWGAHRAFSQNTVSPTGLGSPM
ncbi:Mitochondrial distribution and morphology protein 12, partial [Ascosphaera pollenicola]